MFIIEGWDLISNVKLRDKNDFHSFFYSVLDIKAYGFTFVVEKFLRNKRKKERKENRNIGLTL